MTATPLGTIHALLVEVHSQYELSNGELFKSRLRAIAREAEKNLMLAVLQNAIEDFRKYASASDRRGRLLYQEAEEWILERNTKWFLSFESICETLLLSPDHLRRALRRQTRQRKAVAIFETVQ